MWLLLLLFLAVLAVVFVIGLVFWGLKKALFLALNSVVGFFALYAIKAFVWESLVLNWLSVILVAAFGIFGFAAVLVLHGFGWAF